MCIFKHISHLECWHVDQDYSDRTHHITKLLSFFFMVVIWSATVCWRGTPLSGINDWILEARIPSLCIVDKCMFVDMFQVLNPFYIFQIASIILWSLDDYYIYASCILLISVISLSVELYEIRQVGALLGCRYVDMQVFCLKKSQIP